MRRREIGAFCNTSCTTWGNLTKQQLTRKTKNKQKERKVTYKGKEKNKIFMCWGHSVNLSSENVPDKWINI